MSALPASPALPPRAGLEGPSYPAGLKLVASVLMAGVVGSGLRAAGPIAEAGLPTDVIAAMVVAGLMMVTGYAAILGSRTVIDGERLVQRGLWRREVALADIVQIRLIEAPRLRWLVATRLVVRARTGWPVVYSSGDSRVTAAWRLLAYGDGGD